MPIAEAAPRRRVVAAIGTAQVLAWGSSYYLMAVLAKPVAADTGWPMPWIVGGLSLAMLVSGLVSPAAGRLIEAHGGRPVLGGSALLLAAGLVVIALAPGLAVFLAGWGVLGLAMGAGLYDPAFAALGRLYGEQARPAITAVTLWAGFASTVCWPLTALLVEQVGWRGACLAYAAIALGIIWPLYRFGMPREAPLVPLPAPARPAGGGPDRRRAAVVVFAAVMTLASVITTVVSVHLIAILEARGLSLGAAVGLGALFGPAQVGARVIEACFGRRHHPIWTLVISSVGVTLGLAMLVGSPSVIAAGLVLYGAASGIRSIARGTVPLALVGRAGYAALMGRIALPVLVTQAASPAIGSVLMRQWGPDGTLLALCAAAAVGVGLTVVLFALAGRLGPAEASTPA